MSRPIQLIAVTRPTKSCSGGSSSAQSTAFMQPVAQPNRMQACFLANAVTLIDNALCTAYTPAVLNEADTGNVYAPINSYEHTAPLNGHSI